MISANTRCCRWYQTAGTASQRRVGAAQRHGDDGGHGRVAGQARAINLAFSADIAACMSLEALNGTDQAYDPRVHALRPHHIGALRG